MKRCIPQSITISRCILVFVTLVVSGIPQTAFAYDEQFYQSNDILYYNPLGSACTTPGANYTSRMDIPTLVGNENAEKIWNFLTDEQQGLTKEQAAGVMGNMAQESGFKPDLEEGEASYNKHSVRPVGYGIVQWTGARRTALEAAAESQGVSAADLGFQLAYMIQESQDRRVSKSVADLGYGKEGENEWETLKQQETIEDATVFWHNNFEVSQDSPESVIAVRGAYAQNAYTSFKDMVTSGLPTSNAHSSSASNCAPFAGGDLIQTLLAYAHPTHTAYANNNRVDPEPKPAYVEVATRLQNEKKWVGGGNITSWRGAKRPINPFPAIDCGGFVSILITQSGFEPEYNYGLDEGKGASNQIAQLKWARENWTEIGIGGTFDISELRPGDVAYTHEDAVIPGHTFLYVGQIDGFEGQFASASYDSWRAPMAAGSYENPTDKNYVWYGKR